MWEGGGGEGYFCRVEVGGSGIKKSPLPQVEVDRTLEENGGCYVNARCSHRKFAPKAYTRVDLNYRNSGNSKNRCSTSLDIIGGGIRKASADQAMTKPTP